MSVVTSIYTVLDAALTESVYPQVLPQNPTVPAVTYNLDDDEESTLLDGTTEGLKQTLFTVDCWAATYAAAHTLADAVKTALVGSTGTFGTVTADHLRKEREIDLFEADTRLHRVSLQFLLAYC